MSDLPSDERHALQADPAGVYRLVFEASPDHVAISRVADGRYIDVNPGFQHFTGYQRHEVVGRTSRELGVWRSDEERAAFIAHLRSGNKAPFPCVLRIRNGQARDVEITTAITELAGEQVLVTVVSDITERKRAAIELAQYRQHLEHLVTERTEELRVAHARLEEAHARLVVREQQSSFSAEHDSLTGLPNRAQLMNRLTQALAGAQHGGRQVALLFIDLDDFKRINDSLGHDAGDAALCRTAERLKASVRHGDLVARLGGDEFVIMLTEACSVDAVSAIARKVIGNLQAPITIGSASALTGVSVGIAIGPADGADAQHLLRSADAAMYRAKVAGKGRFSVFSQPPAST